MNRPRWIYGVKGLTPGARLCLALLWSYAPLGARTAFVWPSVQSLTRWLNQHERSTRRQLESLTDAKLIKRSKRETQGGDVSGWVLDTPGWVTETSVTETPAEHDRHVRIQDRPPDRDATQPGPRRPPGVTETPPIVAQDGAFEGTTGEGPPPPLTYPGENPARALERQVAGILEQRGIPHNPSAYVFTDAVRAVSNGDYTPEQLGEVLDAFDAGKRPPGVERLRLFQHRYRSTVRRVCLGLDPGPEPGGDDLPIYTGKAARA